MDLKVNSLVCRIRQEIEEQKKDLFEIQGCISDIFFELKHIENTLDDLEKEVNR